MVGYVSESDKQACIKVIQKAVKATGGDPYATARYIQNAMLTAASGIRPDEEVEVEGVKMLVSYTDKAIYDGTIQIANMEDLSTVDDKDAIKAILMERAKNNLPLLMEPDYYEDSYGNYDYYDEKIVPNRPIEDITKEANKLTDEELDEIIDKIWDIISNLSINTLPSNKICHS